MTAIMIHVDGGPSVGLGHASRGLALAHALQRSGHALAFSAPPNSGIPRFIQEQAQGSSVFEVDDAGLASLCTEQQASALVIDSYRFDPSHVTQLTSADVVIARFDDTADEHLPVDILVNGSPLATNLPYRGYERTRYLLGPDYQVVRPEFTSTSKKSHAPVARTLLVLTGGDSSPALSRELLAYLGTHFLPRWPLLQVIWVLGPFAQDVPGQAETSHNPRISFKRNPRDLRSLMDQADVSLSAGGQTLFELARCGTPTVAFCLGSDQVNNLLGLEGLGAIIYTGWFQSESWTTRLDQALSDLLADAALRSKLGNRAASVIDGQGATRIAAAISDAIASKRSVASAARQLR